MSNVSWRRLNQLGLAVAVLATFWTGKMAIFYMRATAAPPSRAVADKYGDLAQGFGQAFIVSVVVAGALLVSALRQWRRSRLQK